MDEFLVAREDTKMSTRRVYRRSTAGLTFSFHFLQWGQKSCRWIKLNWHSCGSNSRRTSSRHRCWSEGSSLMVVYPLSFLGFQCIEETSSTASRRCEPSSKRRRRPSRWAKSTRRRRSSRWLCSGEESKAHLSSVVFRMVQSCSRNTWLESETILQSFARSEWNPGPTVQQSLAGTQPRSC